MKTWFKMTEKEHVSGMLHTTAVETCQVMTIPVQLSNLEKYVVNSPILSTSQQPFNIHVILKAQNILRELG